MSSYKHGRKCYETSKGYNLGNVFVNKLGYVALTGFNKDNNEYRYLTEIGCSTPSTSSIAVSNGPQSLNADIYLEYSPSNGILTSNILDASGAIISKSDKVSCGSKYIQLDIVAEITNPLESINLHGIFAYTGENNRQLIVDNRFYSVLFNDNDDISKLSRVANRLHHRYLISKYSLEDSTLKILINSSFTLVANGLSSLLVHFGCVNGDENIGADRISTYTNYPVNTEVSSFPLSSITVPPLPAVKIRKCNGEYLY